MDRVVEKNIVIYFYFEYIQKHLGNTNHKHFA